MGAYMLRCTSDVWFTTGRTLDTGVVGKMIKYEQTLPKHNCSRLLVSPDMTNPVPIGMNDFGVKYIGHKHAQ